MSLFLCGLVTTIASSVSGDDLSVVVVGDVLMVEAPPGECLTVMDGVLTQLQNADLATANLETSLVGEDIAPAATSGGLWLRADAETDAWLGVSGLDVVSLANNHRGDWGIEGALQTRSRLDAVGVRSVGFGADDEQAWAPVVTGVGNLTVALVAAYCGATDHSIRARDPEQGFSGRAGIATIGTRWVVELDVGKFAVFTAMLRQAGMQVAPGAATVWIGNQEYRRAAESSIVAELDRSDLERLCRSVDEASKKADIVLVSLHCAEGEGNGSMPPRTLRDAMTDLTSAGADVVFVHGPHHVRGAEWFGSGSVALYGLGSLVMQQYQVAAQPREAYRRWGVDPDDGVEVLRNRVALSMGPDRELWAGVAAHLTFSSDRLTQVELVALDLAGNGATDPCRGLPAIAVGQRRDEILGAVETRSAGFEGQLERSAHGSLLTRGPGARSAVP